LIKTKRQGEPEGPPRAAFLFDAQQVRRLAGDARPDTIPTVTFDDLFLARAGALAASNYVLADAAKTK
jgi:hypothetical protein